MKARYLIFFSYIGSPFRSSEKLWMKGQRNHADPESIQGLMEIALLKLRSLNYPNVILSSRTDGGVHALNNSAHFDLERFGSKIYEPDNVGYQLNKTFHFTKSPIYIRKCLRVNDHFSARFNAIRRTYLYRLAILKQDVTLPENMTIASVIPIEEWKRCHFVRVPGFDVERFKEGAKQFVGYHDFTTFKNFDKKNQHKHNRREIYSIEVKPGIPTINSYSLKQDNLFDYWDIEIQGRGFVHNQIRRILGTLLSVAKGKLDLRDIKIMLQVPSKHSWHSFLQVGPPDGLYLCNVEYNAEDLLYNPDSVTETQDTQVREEDSESE